MLQLCAGSPFQRFNATLAVVTNGRCFSSRRTETDPYYAGVTNSKAPLSLSHYIRKMPHQSSTSPAQKRQNEQAHHRFSNNTPGDTSTDETYRRYKSGEYTADFSQAEFAKRRANTSRSSDRQASTSSHDHSAPRGGNTASEVRGAEATCNGWEMFGTSWWGLSRSTLSGSYERFWTPAGHGSPQWYRRQQQRKEQRKKRPENASTESTETANSGTAKDATTTRTSFSARGAQVFDVIFESIKHRKLPWPKVRPSYRNLKAWFLTLGVIELTLMATVLWLLNPWGAPILKWISDRPRRLYVTITGMFVGHEIWMGKHHPLGEEWESEQGPYWAPKN